MKFFQLVMTLFLLCSFTQASAQTVHRIEAGADVIGTAYEAAAPGDIIELVTDGGEYIEGNDLVIIKDKPVTIRAAAGLKTKPHWYASGGWALIQTADDLTLEGLLIDGTVAGGAREVGIRGAEPEWYALKLGYTLKILNCDFVNFDYAIYGEDSNQLDSLIIDGSTFTHIIKQAIQFSGGSIAPGQVRHFFCTNSTFWDIGGYAIYLQSTAIDASPQATFVVDHVTIHDAAEGNIYPRDIDGAVIKNTIITNSGSSPGSVCLISGLNSRISHLLYDGLDQVALEAGALDNQLTNVWAGVDPLYASAVSGNFTLMTGSPAIGAGDDGKSLGDPRWWPENNSEYVFVFAGENTLADAVAAAVAGQTIMLVSDGGLYENSHKMVIDKELTIRSADGLTQRPLLTSGAPDAIFEIGAGFTLEGVILDGALGADSTAVGITNAPNTTGYNLKVRKTDFLNFSDKGQTTGFGIFGVPSAVVDTVLVQDCYFAHILDMGISFNDPLTETGSVNVFKVDNCTFWDMNSEAIYIDAYDSKMETKDPEVTFNKLTVFDCGSYNLIAHYIDYSVLTNSLVVLPELNTSYAPSKVYGTNSRVENFLYFNTRDIDLSYGATDFQLVNVVPQENPGLVDPENGNFSYPADSPAVLVGEDGTTIYLGDERWLAKPAADKVYLAAGENVLSAALADALDGQTFILTSNGGVYNESATLLVNKKITIMAAEELTEKPVLTSGAADAMIEISAGLTLKGVILDGAQGAAQTKTGITNAANTSGYNLAVQKCDFLNFSDATGSTGFGIFGHPGAVVDSFLAKDCFFAHIVKMGISFNDPLTPTGSVNVFKVENTTFWDISAEAIYVDGNDSDVATKDPEFYVNKVTAYNCGSYNIMAHYIDYAVIKNSIVSYPVLEVAFSPTRVYGAHSTVENFLYFNTRDIDLGSKATDFQLINVAPQMDPLFVNPDSGNFHYPLDSPAVLFDDDGKPIYLGDDRWWPVISGVAEAKEQTRPLQYSLTQNWPNPFNPETTINFTLPEAGQVRLKIYNMLGEEVASLIDGVVGAGRHQVKWNAADMPSGIYIYTLMSSSYAASRRMILLK